MIRNPGKSEGTTIVSMRNPMQDQNVPVGSDRPMGFHGIAPVADDLRLKGPK